MSRITSRNAPSRFPLATRLPLVSLTSLVSFVSLTSVSTACRTRTNNEETAAPKLFGLGGYKPWELKVENSRERPKNERSDWQPLHCASGNVAIVDADPSYGAVVRLVLWNKETPISLPLVGSSLWMAEPGSNGGGFGKFAMSKDMARENKVTQYATLGDMAKEMGKFEQWVDAKAADMTSYEMFVTRNRYRALNDLVASVKAQRDLFDRDPAMSTLSVTADYQPGTSTIGYDQGGKFNVTIAGGPAGLSGTFSLQCSNDLIDARKEAILKIAVANTPEVVSRILKMSQANDRTQFNAGWQELKALGKQLNAEIEAINAR